MNLREMGAIFDEDVPECVLDEPLEQHFMVDLQEYKHAVQAFWFNSGNPDNPTARSYVFYFFRGEIDKHRRPDDIMTFKVKFSDFSRIHIIDQYLGGAAYGTVNAPPLAVRGSWKPGWISNVREAEKSASFFSIRHSVSNNFSLLFQIIMVR